MISYEGIFFDKETVKLIHSLESKQLTKVNDEIHITFKYHPSDEEVFDEIAGKSFEVYIVGYANDGENSGFEIRLPEELKRYYINYDEDNPNVLKVPHITASLAEGARASNTKKLDFKPLEKPIKIKGKFGFWVKDGKKEYLLLEKHVKKSR